MFCKMLNIHHQKNHLAKLDHKDNLLKFELFSYNQHMFITCIMIGWIFHSKIILVFGGCRNPCGAMFFFIIYFFNNFLGCNNWVQIFENKNSKNRLGPVLLFLGHLNNCPGPSLRKPMRGGYVVGGRVKIFG